MPLDELDQFDGYGLDREVGRFQPRECQQVVDQAFQVAGLDQHGLSGPLSAVRTDDTVGQRLRVALERCQGRTQLVGDGEQEVSLPALARRQRLGQAIQGVGEVFGLGRGLGDQAHRAVARREPIGGRRRVPDRPGHPAGEQRAGQATGDEPGEQR